MPCTSTTPGPPTRADKAGDRGLLGLRGLKVSACFCTCQNAGRMQHHRKVPQACLYLVFVFLIVHSYMFSMASFLLIDPICSKQIQIVGTCYHILYQKSSWIFCDTYPANVSVVNSSMMHFDRGKKHTYKLLSTFLLLLPCSGNHPRKWLQFFFCVFSKYCWTIPMLKKLEEFKRLRYFIKKNKLAPSICDAMLMFYPTHFLR